MRIAFDCDGVLLNMLGQSRKIVAEMKEQTIDQVMQSEKRGVWDIQTRFDLTGKQVHLFWKNMKWGRMQALPNAENVLRFAQEQLGFNNVFFVTMLNSKNHDNRLKNLQNLFGKNLVINSEQVYFTEHGQSKAEILKKLSINVFVEDSLRNLIEAHDNSKCVKHFIWTEFNERTLEFKQNLAKAGLCSLSTIGNGNFTNEVIAGVDVMADVNKLVQMNNGGTTFEYTDHMYLLNALKRVL